MADKPTKGVFSAVLIAGLITLVVTLVRLYGELHQWDPKYFSREPGGQGALIGISWLVPIFAFWFGRRLAQSGKRPSGTGRALLFCLIGIAISAAGGYLAFGADLGWDEKTNALVAGSGFLVGSLLLLVAWPAGYVTQLFYGLLARIPVIVITYIAVDRSWDVHYAKARPGSLHGGSPDEALIPLITAQATFWLFAWTVLVGGVFAILGAATARK